MLSKAVHRFNAIPMTSFIEVEKNPKIYREPQKTSNNQWNLKKEQGGKHHASLFPAIWQSYSNQSSVVLAKQASKQTNKKHNGK